MQPDAKIPAANDVSQGGSAPPPVLGSPASPPLMEPKPQPAPLRELLAVLLSLCLGLFLADAVISLVDDSLILFFGLHLLAGIRGMVCLFSILIAIVIYGLMGLAPMIPKRLFLPVTLFNPVAPLIFVPITIFFYGHLQVFAWGVSCGQVILGVWILYRVQGGLKFRWPLVATHQLAARRFSWRNLSVFLLANVFVLPAVVMVYLFLCTAVAVDHFSEGFMSLRPAGFSVQVRKYVRADGKTIQLFPMSHVAEADFYRKISQTFPTNSIILMEGVTDEKNLLTNKISYKRMAKSLGLAEQHEKFEPTRGELVMADVDVGQFTRNTIDFLNLVIAAHTQDLNIGMILKLLQYSPPPHFEEQLFDDLLLKRNQHLLGEIHSHLSQTDNLMVPWGVAHMPGIAREIQKSGFHLDGTQDYMVIRFHGADNQTKGVKE